MVISKGGAECEEWLGLVYRCGKNLDSGVLKVAEKLIWRVFWFNMAING